MKIYAITSSSHNILRDEWFLPSIRDEFPVEVEEVEQLGNGSIGTTDFNKIMLQKVNLILRAIEEQWGGWFIYSDVDIQFLRPFKAIAEEAARRTDISFQRDSPTGELCAGFFVARANNPVKVLWTNVKTELEQNLNEHDQTWLNRSLDPKIWIKDPRCPLTLRACFLICRGLRLLFRTQIFCGLERRIRLKIQSLSGCRIGLLPDHVFGAGTFTGAAWNRSKPFPVPTRAAVHHANYASGLGEKVAQLRYVLETIKPSESPKQQGNSRLD